ncbi:hypothetical protein FYK42_23670 (plasmid) [Escherichia coli]|nr:hypothetical protein FYK42_23670 [Escherichia coli]
MGSCAAPSAKGDDKFITTDYLQQCRFSCTIRPSNNPELRTHQSLTSTTFSVPVMKLTSSLRPSGYSFITHPSGVFRSA